MTEKYIDLSVKFTKAYKRYYDAYPGIREMMCLKAVYPENMAELNPDAVFAGGFDWLNKEYFYDMPIMFSLKKDSQIGYYAAMPELKKLRELYPHRGEEIDELITFWKEEATFAKILKEAPEDIKEYLFPYGMGLDEHGYKRKAKFKKPSGSGFISGSFDSRLAGLMPDFRNILKGGIPGLYKKTEECEAKNGTNDYYKAVRLSLSLITDILEHYRLQAEAMLENNEAENLKEHCRILKSLQNNAPQTLREAMQLTVIFTLLTGIDNFGRLDVSFGDFLAEDLKAKRLNEESAIKLISDFWEFISENCGSFDSRVIIGGKGRDNEENADRFALLAMEATRRRHDIKPVLTLRLYDEQNPELFEKALDLISEGCIYPTLYNDDACIPGFEKSMNLPYEDAADYAPLGCGEIVISGKSIGSPNSTFRMLKALEAVLHNGNDGPTGQRIGIPTGTCDELDTFQKLMDAFFAQLDARLAIDAKLHRYQREISSRETSFVTASLLMNDCLEAGKGIMQGGIKYFGANIEGFGLTNTVNSLAVIKKYVYDEKKFTLQQLVNILDADFEGYEKERHMFEAVPKYGNDADETDIFKTTIENFINERADFYGRKEGFHYCTIANVNPGGITIGPSTAASADGRKCGKPFALGNSPMPGTDKSGLTAFLKSAAKSAPENGGYVTNLHISGETFLNHREKTAQLLRTYFAIGGLQLNINCFGKEDLKKALENPELYPNLIVRVSGYSAKFVDLDRITQKHIAERTIY